MNPQTKKRILTVGIFQPLNAKSNRVFILKALPALCEDGINILCLNKGDKDALDECKKQADQYTKLTLVDDIETLYKKCDAVLFAGDVDEDILKKTKSEKIVPILEETEGYETFNAQKESGNAFTFESGNFWQFLFAIHRAAMNYEFSYDWSTIKRNMDKN